MVLVVLYFLSDPLESFDNVVSQPDRWPAQKQKGMKSDQHQLYSWSDSQVVEAVDISAFWYQTANRPVPGCRLVIGDLCSSRRVKVVRINGMEDG